MWDGDVHDHSRRKGVSTVQPFIGHEVAASCCAGAGLGHVCEPAEEAVQANRRRQVSFEGFTCCLEGSVALSWP